MHVPDSRWVPFVHAGVAAGVIGVLSWAAVAVSSSGGGVALWWPAAGAAVAAVVTARPPARAWIVLMILAVVTGGNVLGGRPLAVSVAFGVSNAAEAGVAGWWLLRGVSGRPSLATLTDLWRLLIAAVLGATVVALGASLTVVLLAGRPAWPTILHVLISHASAVLLIVPLVLRQPREDAPSGRPEAYVQAALTLVTAVAVFSSTARLTLPFLVLAPLVWGAMRLGLRLVTVEVVVTLSVALTLTAFGLGPFGGMEVAGWFDGLGDARLDFVVTQMFVVTVFVIVMAMVISESRRRALLARVELSERILRGGFNDSLVGAAILRQRDGHLELVEGNEVARDLLGLGSNYPDAWAAGAAAQSEALRGVLLDVAAGRLPNWRDEVELAAKDGRPRWAEIAASALSGEQGLLIVQTLETTGRKALEAELADLAIHDTLTGLPNRTLLGDRLERSIATAARTGMPVTVLFVDLDGFKQVTDTAGNAGGDEVLREVAERLVAAEAYGDAVGRIGADKFVILHPGAGPLTVGACIARTQQAFTEPFSVPSGVFRLSASIGVSASGPGSTVDQLLRDAEMAMYASKSHGRGLATWFEPSFREHALHAATVTAEFEGAVERGEIVLLAQPIIDLQTGHIVAAEALVRWQHPVHGLLGPNRWLDIVLASPTGQDLEGWILGRACDILASWWPRWGDDCPSLHVNASTSLLDRGDLAEQVKRALDTAGAPATKLVVELTETVVESARPSLAAELERMRATGVRISVDDFGTGYSALSRLASLPVDELKIDQSFVAQMLTDDRSKAIVNAIVGLAGALRLRMVAEGVEDPEQAEYLRRLGCQRGQGYLWARPGPVDDLEGTIDRGLASS